MSLADPVKRKLEEHFPENLRAHSFAKEALEGVELPEISTDWLQNFGKTPHIGKNGRRAAQYVLHDYYLNPAQDRSAALEAVTSALAASHDHELSLQSSSLVDSAYACGITRLCNEFDAELAAATEKAAKAAVFLKYMKMGLPEVKAHADSKL